ncbi:hypothetical protein M8998_10975 [Sphingobacterium sp. lm-10]|uniref:hypothetical protein n=1 Tax=Sphingobacterium sp. lm-10 TaxID=2944904 RepID=UPI002021BAB2|nr:hypothetical protein [Sphingobacterium sp. lm-10]MCL7988463.1 hypothetical protein [Sphingobacterium sp. lm-10]
MKKYISPLIEVVEVQVEEAFAAGSVSTVTPVENGAFAQDEYNAVEQPFDVNW